uniref:Uncharacterized protein n=1 Tax=Arundo donax TaxID=35708 RepID=A0A0A9FQM7_ARUDO
MLVQMYFSSYVLAYYLQDFKKHSCFNAPVSIHHPVAQN